MGRRAPPPPPPPPATAPGCALCGRDVAALTVHHLVPKSHGGTETVPLCFPCHKTIHAFFSNDTLARVYPTLDALRATDEIRVYLRWVRRQPDRHIRVYSRRRP